VVVEAGARGPTIHSGLHLDAVLEHGEHRVGERADVAGLEQDAVHSVGNQLGQRPVTGRNDRNPCHKSEVGGASEALANSRGHEQGCSTIEQRQQGIRLIAAMERHGAALGAGTQLLLEVQLARRRRRRRTAVNTQGDGLVAEQRHRLHGQVGSLGLAHVAGKHKAAVAVVLGQLSEAPGPWHGRRQDLDARLLDPLRHQDVPYELRRRQQLLTLPQRGEVPGIAQPHHRHREQALEAPVAGSTGSTQLWTLAGVSVAVVEVSARTDREEIVQGPQHPCPEASRLLREAVCEPLQTLEVHYIGFVLSQDPAEFLDQGTVPQRLGQPGGKGFHARGSVLAVTVHGMRDDFDALSLERGAQLADVQIQATACGSGQSVCQQQDSHFSLQLRGKPEGEHQLHLARACPDVNNELAPPTGKARLMPPTVPPDLSAIVVAFDSGAQLRRCLDSIRREVGTEDITSEIVVVDNGAGDETARMLAGDPDLLFLKNPHNAGFGAAVNQGFRNSQGRLVLLLNPDAELEEGALAPLLETLNSDPDTDLAAPALILPDGSRQKSPRRFYKPATVLARRTPLGRTALGRKLLNEHLMADCRDDQSAAVDWVSGAAMLLRRDAVPRHGPFDERYFLYFEDVDLCRRMNAAGRTVRFQPRSRVRHHLGAGSRRQVLWNPLLWRHLQSALLYALAWSPTWWRSRWWRSAVNRMLGWGLRVALLGGTAVLMSESSEAMPGSLQPWSLPVVATLSLLGASLVPSAVFPLVGRGPLPSLPKLAVRLCLAGVSVISVFAAVQGAVISITALLLTSAWALLASTALAAMSRIQRAVRRRLRRTGPGRVRCLVAGNPESAATLAARIGEDHNEGLALLGYVPLEPLCEGGPMPRLPSWSQVVSLSADLRAEAVLLVGNPEELARTADEVSCLRRAGVSVTYIMTGANELLQPEQGLRVSGYPALQLGSGVESRALMALSQMAGRITAAAGLLLLLPIAPLLLAASAVASRRSPVLACKRVGSGGSVFSMWRLRSGPGTEGFEGGGALGRLLRWLHVDELPQLINVVCGEMALVGPRPIAPALAADLHDWQRARFRVRPGITGVWQLDRLRRWRLEEMIASDLLYVLRWSPALDAGILSETLLGRRNP